MLNSRGAEKHFRIWLPGSFQGGIRETLFAVWIEKLKLNIAYEIMIFLLQLSVDQRCFA